MKFLYSVFIHLLDLYRYVINQLIIKMWLGLFCTFIPIYAGVNRVKWG